MGRRIFDLTVAQAAEESNELDLGFVFSFAIQGPVTLTETATVEISNDGVVWDDAKDDAGDPVTVAANTLVEVVTSAAKARISLSEAAAADRLFVVSAVEYRV